MSSQVEAVVRAEDAEERGEGICRTCLAPIWNEGGTIGRRHRPEGWSDRNERGGDSLVCFSAVDYRHVPLTGREACIYDRAFARGVAAGPGGADPKPTEEQPVEVFGKPYHGWTCDCGDCLDHDARAVPRPGEGRS